MKTKSEIVLECKYGDLTRGIERILELFGLDMNVIDNNLDIGFVTQSDYDSALLNIIDTVLEIKGGK